MLLALRGYGARSFRAGSGTLPERMQRFGFAKLDEDPGRELVFGLAGRFWRPAGDLRRLAGREAFIDFAEYGCVKAAWNLRIVPVSEGACDLTTETRIQCLGAPARRKFRAYWTIVRPFSGLLRRALLRSVARRAQLPGR